MAVVPVNATGGVSSLDDRGISGATRPWFGAIIMLPGFTNHVKLSNLLASEVIRSELISPDD